MIAVARRPSPALALGASSSPLVHRLDAMTRLRPDRPRLARFMSLALLVLPLVAAAVAVPDPAAAEGYAAPTQVAAPDPDPAAVEPVPEAPAPDAEPAATPDDSLAQHIETIDVQRDGEDVRIELTLRAGTPRAVALAIADQMSEGGRPGRLVVRGAGEPIVRSTLRSGSFAESAPPAPPAPSRPTAAPPAPPAPLAPPTGDELARVVEALEAELLDVSRELDALRVVGFAANVSAEDRTRYIRLETRHKLIETRYRHAVQELESWRLSGIIEDARKDGAP